MTALESHSVGIYEAKTHFASVIEQVLAGHIITITKHGKPVATISPVSEDSLSSAELLAKLSTVRKFTVTRDLHDMRKLIGRDDH